MDYIAETSASLNRPIGARLNAAPIVRDGEKWDMYMLPAHDGRARDVVFIKRPSFLQRLRSWLWRPAK
jgi:hypothetical protein